MINTNISSCMPPKGAIFYGLVIWVWPMWVFGGRSPGWSGCGSGGGVVSTWKLIQIKELTTVNQVFFIFINGGISSEP